MLKLAGNDMRSWLGRWGRRFAFMKLQIRSACRGGIILAGDEWLACTQTNSPRKLRGDVQCRPGMISLSLHYLYCSVCLLPAVTCLDLWVDLAWSDWERWGRPCLKKIGGFCRNAIWACTVDAGMQPEIKYSPFKKTISKSVSEIYSFRFICIRFFFLHRKYRTI